MVLHSVAEVYLGVCVQGSSGPSAFFLRGPKTSKGPTHCSVLIVSIVFKVAHYY